MQKHACHFKWFCFQIKGFLEVLAPLVSIEGQMKNLISCMTSLFSASTLPVNVSFSFIREIFFTIHRLILGKPACMRFNFILFKKVKTSGVTIVPDEVYVHLKSFQIMEEFHEKYGGMLGSHDIRSDARKVMLWDGINSFF